MLHADNPIILKISYIGYDVCTITPLDENSVVKSGKKRRVLINQAQKEELMKCMENKIRLFSLPVVNGFSMDF